MRGYLRFARGIVGLVVLVFGVGIMAAVFHEGPAWAAWAVTGVVVLLSFRLIFDPAPPRCDICGAVVKRESRKTAARSAEILCPDCRRMAAFEERRARREGRGDCR